MILIHLNCFLNYTRYPSAAFTQKQQINDNLSSINTLKGYGDYYEAF